MKKLLLFTLAAVVLLSPGLAAEVTGKFAPPAGKVLVFAGQDNASVGGTAKYRDGYVDNVGVPGGITHYVYFSEGWTNAFDRTFAKGAVAGLNTETEWASGPMHQKAYLDSPILDRCVMHVSIAMEGNCEDQVADGSFDHLIAEFVKFIGDHPDHPFLIRIGYEFDGSWNKYDPENFKKAFRRIVDALRKEKLTNFATVFASSSSVKPGQFEEYDPGADYYEWVGYSWWGGEKDALPALEFARKVEKPVFIAEATPRGHFFGKEDPEMVWDTWFEKFFAHIEDNMDVVRAVSYINADWDGQDMWDGWGQTRLETAPLLKKRWLEKMASPVFLNAADKPFGQIGFTPGEEPQQAASSEPKNGATVYPYKNPALPVPERVEDLLGRMTIDEKVAQITGWWHYDEQKLLAEGAIFTPEFWARKCPHGIGELGPLHNLTVEEDAKMYAAVQEYFRQQTRLGIPAIIHDEAAHGFMKFEANSFPAPVGLACAWNPELMVEVYTQAGREARSRGVSHVLSPVVDVARDLRWGRVDETLGEDSFLVGRLGAAMVRGLQGSADGTIAPGHVAATLKHFAGYAGTEGGRNRSPYSHGPRHLLDNEVAPFRHVIRTAKPAAVMAAFNEVDGLPCHVNPWVLTEVLRDRLGFEGLTVGDYQGIDLVRRYQKIAASDAAAGRMALEAGLQLELPNNFGFKHLPQLVKDGEVEVTRIDEPVRAVLSLKFRLGLFEAPGQIDVAKAKALHSSDEATRLARKAARQSIVLLKNEDNFLPLTPGAHKKIAVIGPNAAVCRLGNYSGKPLKTVSLVDGIRNILRDQAAVNHAEGCKIAHNDTGDSYENWRYVNEIEFASVEDNRPLIDEAVALAMDSDLVFLALGENVLLSREAWGDNHTGDRATFDLTESQQVLAAAIVETGKPVVIVLNNGKPVTLHELGETVPAILTLHYAGQETGTAAAEILFGKANPSGKLTVSWPRSVGHLPAHYSQHGSAQVFDYVDSPRGPAYPFGHGLSYTGFEYQNAALSAESLRPGESVQVSFDLTNTGKRPGTEIAQVYVSGEEFAIARPGLELKGFTRVTLNPGETRKVTVALHANDLHFHDSSLRRVFPKGKYLVRVGGSSAKLTEPLTLTTLPQDQDRPQAKAHSGSSPRPDALPSKPKPATAGKPNVLFIAIDDLRPELGCYGSKTLTPNIDRLAATGMRFDRAYCQQAVCGASRLSIMGGLYPTKTREQTFHVEGWRERHAGLVTMNQHFGAQGYQTVGLGKIFHGHRGGPGVDEQNWTRWINIDADDYALPGNRELLEAAIEAGKVGNSRDPAKGPTTEIADVHDDTYADGKRAAKAVELLHEFAATKADPFFLAVGFTKPHLPFVAPKKYWDLYRREDFAMPPNLGIPPGYPQHAANLPAHEMQKYSDFEGDLPTDFSDEMNRRLLHGYSAATSYADACFGRVMEALEQTGLAGNTIVVMWGDHGWKLGDHATWCKHTNFECDARVPLVIRDPRLKGEGGQSTPRLVELIDLYPTLCDLTGIPTPPHCQGRSFRPLLSDPGAGHRYDTYSSYPAWKSVGHSLRFGNYRYTEWHDDETGAVKERVLTDLGADPGEETNVIDLPAHAEALAKAVDGLRKRIAAARADSPRRAASRKGVPIDLAPANRRQVIDGFGGSVAFWATSADDEAIEAAVTELRVNIIRVQGEVTKAGELDHNRDLLQRALKLNPAMEVLLTFWQPRSAAHPDTDYWLDSLEIDGEVQYVMKPSREEAWADELVARVKLYLDWGIKVTIVGIQNESNWSHEGTQTCRWEPERLRTFIEEKVKPRLLRAGLGGLKIAAPDLAYIGAGGSEVTRFLPVLQSPAVDVAAYHMYDSYRDRMDSSLSILVENTKAIGALANEHFPEKRLWMTETTGAQWNGEEWHTYGWTPDLTEHEKAIKAARYIHMTFADAGANAFLWWGLIYSLAPEGETNPKTREKHRDEGLVLVKQERVNGRQPFLERPKKFFVFKQYATFVRPGFRRIEVASPENLQLSAFISPDGRQVVAVAVNDTNSPQGPGIAIPEGFSVTRAHQTDLRRNCEEVDPAAPLPPKSVRTFIFEK